jgi:hypothetical protein
MSSNQMFASSQRAVSAISIQNSSQSVENLYIKKNWHTLGLENKDRLLVRTGLPLFWG